MKSFPRSEFPIPFHATSGIGLGINSSGPGQHLIMCWARSHVEGAGVYQNLRQRRRGLRCLHGCFRPAMSSHPFFWGRGLVAVYLLSWYRDLPSPPKKIKLQRFRTLLTAFSLCISYMPQDLKKKSQPPFPFCKIPTQPGPISWPFDFLWKSPMPWHPQLSLQEPTQGSDNRSKCQHLPMRRQKPTEKRRGKALHLFGGHLYVFGGV